MASLHVAFDLFLASCNSNNRSCVAGTFVFGNAVGMAVGLNPI